MLELLPAWPALAGLLPLFIDPKAEPSLQTVMLGASFGRVVTAVPGILAPMANR